MRRPIPANFDDPRIHYDLNHAELWPGGDFRPYTLTVQTRKGPLILRFAWRRQVELWAAAMPDYPEEILP